MQPKPSTSKRLAQRKAFWNAIALEPHERKFDERAEPGREAAEEHPAEDEEATA